MSIKLKIKKAFITNRTTILMGNMSPKCEIKYGSETKITNFHEDSHDAPVWDEEFVFEKTDQNEINLTL